MKRIYLRNIKKYALVNNKDFLSLRTKKWCGVKIYNTYYCIRYGGRKHIYMHRELLKPNSRRKHIDHKDNNGLNNQRRNLRIVTPSINILNGRKRKNNTSGYTGVSFNKKIRKWEAYIMLNRRQTRIGFFLRKTHAYKARRQYMKGLKHVI